MSELDELAERVIHIVDTPVAHNPDLWCKILRLEEKCRHYEETLATMRAILALAEKK
jgi:hypothetical protein